MGCLLELIPRVPLMRPTMDTNPLVELDIRYRPQIELSYDDLFELARLHVDFVGDCINAISAKERRVSSPLLGKLFPHLVAEGLELPASDRLRPAAAWPALYRYICLVNFKLDRFGSLDARASLGASALLGWAVATLAEITSGSGFSRVFLDNMQWTLSGQYEDIQNRKDPNYDRRASDVSKNRAVLGVIAGYCAAGREPDDHLIRSTELMLGPFQLLDDLQDLAEDLREQNITSLVKIIRQVLPREPDASNVPLLYSTLI